MHLKFSKIFLRFYSKPLTKGRRREREWREGEGRPLHITMGPEPHLTKKDGSAWSSCNDALRHQHNCRCHPPVPQATIRSRRRETMHAGSTTLGLSAAAASGRPAGRGGDRCQSSWVSDSAPPCIDGSTEEATKPGAEIYRL
jgi:hypothetical protein